MYVRWNDVVFIAAILLPGLGSVDVLSAYIVLKYYLWQIDQLLQYDTRNDLRNCYQV